MLLSETTPTVLYSAESVASLAVVTTLEDYTEATACCSLTNPEYSGYVNVAMLYTLDQVRRLMWLIVFKNRASGAVSELDLYGRCYTEMFSRSRDGNN